MLWPSHIGAAVAVLFLASMTDAHAASVFTYKGDRPGSTTYAEFRQTHGVIYEEDAKHDSEYDQRHFIYEADAAISCSRPVKDGAFVASLRYCDTQQRTFSDVPVLIHWEFVDDVLAYMDSYFPINQYGDTLKLLEQKYGKPTLTAKDVARTDGGAVLPYTYEVWKAEPYALILSGISANTIDKASLEISDRPLHHRYRQLSSQAAI